MMVKSPRRKKEGVQISRNFGDFGRKLIGPQATPFVPLVWIANTKMPMPLVNKIAEHSAINAPAKRCHYDRSIG